MSDIQLETFKESLKLNVVSNNKTFLKDVLEDKNLCDMLIENCMDFLTLIIENIKESHVNKDEGRIYSKIINFIAENSSAKEVICVLNLEIDRVIDDSKFLLLLYPLSVSLQRLPTTSDSTIIIMKDILHSAISFFDRLPVAHYSGLEGKELEVYIQASETQRFLRLSNCYLEFLESFSLNDNFYNDSRINYEILHNILILYNSSLIRLAFYSPGVVSEECRKCCTRAFKLVERHVSCLHQFIVSLQKTNESLSFEITCAKDHDQSESLKRRLVPNPSIACLLYHVFVNQNLTKFPQIFSDLYKFTFCLPIIATCFKESLDTNVLRMCLQLLDELLRSLHDDYRLSWDKNYYPSFFYSLKIVITSNVNREIRGFAFSSFTNAFRKIDFEGRYNLLKTMLKDNDHYGFKGQLILLLKTEIISALSSTDDSRRFFKGGSVYPLLCDVLILPDGDKTDVLNESEWLLAAVNMLYVLLQRDKAHSLGLDVIIDDVVHDFLEPLIKGTDLCLAHYRNDLRLLMDCEESSVIGELSVDCSWMNKKQKVNFINKAILTLDLVRLNTSMVSNIL